MEKIIFDAEDMSARKERNNLKIGLTKSWRGGGGGGVGEGGGYIHVAGRSLESFSNAGEGATTQKAVLVLFAHFWIDEVKSSK